MNVFTLGVILTVAATFLVGTTTVAYAQTTENSFVNTVWGLIAAVSVFVTGISTFAMYWAKKARAIAEKTGNVKLLGILDKYVIPILESGQKVADITARQELKSKQLGEVLFKFMGSAADEIKDKYEIRLKNLTQDVEDATKTAEERQKALEEMTDLIETIRKDIGGIPNPSP